jgi:hypothetical protein
MLTDILCLKHVRVCSVIKVATACYSRFQYKMWNKVAIPECWTCKTFIPEGCRLKQSVTYRYVLNRQYDDNDGWKQVLRHYHDGGELNPWETLWCTDCNTNGATEDKMEQQNKVNSSQKRMGDLPFSGPFIRRNKTAQRVWVPHTLNQCFTFIVLFWPQSVKA